MITLAHSELERRRLRVRVDRASAALQRDKNLESDKYEALLQARLALDGKSGANSRLVADALRRGKPFEIPTDDETALATVRQLESQLNCLRRACMTLRSELLDAIAALDAATTITIKELA